MGNNKIFQRCFSNSNILVPCLLLNIITSTILMLFWFSPFDAIFYFWDSDIIVNTQFETILDRLTLWVDDEAAPGYSEPTVYTRIMWFMLSSFLQNSLGNIWGQYIYILLLFVFGVSSIFVFLIYLHRYMGFSSNYKNITVFLFAFFYIFNFFNAIYIFGNYSNSYLPFFCFLPFSLYSYFKAMENKKYFIWFSFAVLLQSQTFGQPAYFVMFLLLLLLFSCLLLIKNSLIKIAKHFFISLVMANFLLAFYLLSLLKVGSATLSTLVASVGGNYLDIYEQFSSLFQVITFNNFYVMANPDFQAYGKWVLFYNNNIYLQILTAIFFLCLVGTNIFFLVIDRKKIFWINLIYLFLALFLVSAPYTARPFLDLLWKHLPPMQIFRAWDNKVGYIYLYIVLFVTFFTIYAIRNKMSKYVIFFLFFLIYSIYSYPSVSGSFIFNKNHDIKKNPFGKGISQKVKIPNEYFELKKHFNDDKFARILVFPRDQILSSDFFNDGTGYAANGLIPFITGKETNVNGVRPWEYQKLLVSDLYEAEYDNHFIDNVAKYGFTHVLVRKKYNTNGNFIYIDIKDKESFMKFLNKNYYMIYSTNYFDLYDVGSKIFQVEGANIYLQKINSIKYKIYMKNMKGISKLSFIEGFTRDWQLYSNPISDFDIGHIIPIDYNEKTKTTLCKPAKSFFEAGDLKYLWKEAVFEDTHQIENGYANMWSIDPYVIKGNFPDIYYRENADGSIDVNLTLFYKPQATAYLGILISLCALGIIFLYSYCPERVLFKKS